MGPQSPPPPPPTLSMASTLAVMVLVLVTAVATVVVSEGAQKGSLHTVLQVQPPNSEFLENRSPVGSHVPGELRFYFGYQLPPGARGLVAAAFVGTGVRVQGCAQGESLVWTPMGRVSQGPLAGHGFFVSQGCRPLGTRVTLTMPQGLVVNKAGDMLQGCEVTWGV